MRGTFFGLEIGKTGLTTAQFGLDVTGHNIANLDTAGYTRQRIVSTAYDPFSTIGKFAPVGQGLVGGGVRVQILDQIRSAYLDRRFRTESTNHAYWETRTQSLSYIRSFFDNVNEKTSINYSMAEFFRSMTIVSHDPVSGAPRTLMQTTAMDLVQQLNMIYQGLIDFQSVENKAIATKTGDINRIAGDIVELNKAIYSFEITGVIANDLRDKRNLLIDELARYADIEYEELPDKYGHGMMRIRMAGETLVDHDRRNRLEVGEVANPLEGGELLSVPYWVHRMDSAVPRPAPGSSTTDWADYRAAVQAQLDDDWINGNTRTILDMNKVTGGELKAHFDMRDGNGLTTAGAASVDSRDRGLPYYIEMINNLARALVFEINSQHIQGWSDNANGPSRTNILFFDAFDENGESILTNPANATIRYFDADNNEIFPLSPDDPAIARKIFDVPDSVLRQITARNISLSQDIQDSAYNIAASTSPIGRPGDPPQLQRGNNENILDLYKLFSKPGITMLGRDIGTFDDYGTVIRFDVGNTMHSAEQARETARILTLAANNQRTSIAGVSLDEEMVGLVKFNHAYNGAARVITQMDDALDRLINGTGRVGL